MKEYTERDIEDFLLEKYDTKILIYKGFYLLRTILNKYTTIIETMMPVYEYVAEEHKTTPSAVERALRHFRTRVNTNTDTNKELVNLLIIEFQRWL